MSKFLLDTDGLSEKATEIQTLGNNLSDISASISSYDFSETEDIDFSGAISAITSNVDGAAEKIRNTATLMNTVISEHSSLQASMKFEPSPTSSGTGGTSVIAPPTTEVVPTDTTATNVATESTNANATATQATGESSGTTYTVQPGDNLYNIAKAHGTTVAAIAAANNIENVRLIHSGDQFVIPNGNSTSDNTVAYQPTSSDSSTNNEQNNIDNPVEAETSTPTSGLSAQKTIDVPDGLGKVHTYMGWQTITSKSSNQYKLREKAGMNFDSEGFGKIDGRYVVATTTTFGKVGDLVDFHQEDGTVIQGIIGDIKNQSDRGCTEWGHNDGQTIVEFVVDKNTWYNSNHANPGTASCHPEWHQTITKAVNYGNYFDMN